MLSPEEMVEASAREHIFDPEPVKRCTKCRVIKPLSEFYLDKKHADGHKSYCKVCNRDMARRYRDANREKIRAYNRDYDRKRRKEDPEWREYRRKYHRAYQRLYRARAKADPELAARVKAWHDAYYARRKRDRERYREYLDNRRISDRLRRWDRGAQPAPWRAKVKATNGYHTLPAEPFRLWLESIEHRYANHEQMAQSLGINPRQLHGILKQEKGFTTVSLHVVDTVLIEEGETLLFDLYPHLYEDAA